MSISTALEARRDALREREAGFTLIELLVVVIIIGILAAIAIPIYLGVQNNAKEAATKSDLTNNKTAITGWSTDNNGAVPASVTAGTASVTGGVASDGTNTTDLAKYGWSKSNNTTSLTFNLGSGTGTAATWCLDGVSATTTAYRISSNTPVAKGTCAALTAANY